MNDLPIIKERGFRAQRRTVRLANNDGQAVSIRLAGDAYNRMVRLDLAIGRWIQIPIEASKDLRGSLLQAEGALGSIVGMQGKPAPVPPEEALQKGVTLRVSGDFIRQQVVIDMAVDGKGVKWLALSPAESGALRRGLEKVEEALRMQHA